MYSFTYTQTHRQNKYFIKLYDLNKIICTTNIKKSIIWKPDIGENRCVMSRTESKDRSSIDSPVLKSSADASDLQTI